MSEFTSGRIGLAFDMAGCPNRCRHCWLGQPTGGQLSADDVRSVSEDFRKALSTSMELVVSTSFREPDNRDDYRELYDLERELSDGEPARFELLSIRRLARDDSYTGWAKSVGPSTCQISLFGTEITTDWFCRREGAYKDAILATERLLAEGMTPRWQIFVTTELLPDMDELERVIKYHRKGNNFPVFLNLPGPEGEAG